MQKLFAVTTPGLEPYTAQELRNLGMLSDSIAPRFSVVSGGIEFPGDLEIIYRANLHLRTASRVLLRFAQFHAAAFSELDKRARRLPWEQYITPGQPVAVRATCHKSRLYHSAAVANVIVKVIGERLGKPVVQHKFDENAQGPLPQLVLVRLANDRCTLSIDTSGALLHRRGYRLETAKAPLRETLAAGLLLASGWDAQSPLIDPFCGSGTIAIEAAMLACRMAPGCARRFAFMDWPGFSKESWQAMITESQQALHTDVPPIQASDRDAGAIKIALANAQRTGVSQYIEFTHRAVSAIEPAGSGWVVTNPPYGLRVSANQQLRNLYAQFGNVLRRLCPGWQVSVLCSDLQLLSQMKMPLDTSLRLVNGGLKVWVGRGSVNSPD